VPQPAQHAVVPDRPERGGEREEARVATSTSRTAPSAATSRATSSASTTSSPSSLS
jgi:hypothetical protein